MVPETCDPNNNNSHQPLAEVRRGQELMSGCRLTPTFSFAYWGNKQGSSSCIKVLGKKKKEFYFSSCQRYEQNHIKICVTLNVIYSYIIILRSFTVIISPKLILKYCHKVWSDLSCCKICKWCKHGVCICAIWGNCVIIGTVFVYNKLEFYPSLKAIHQTCKGMPGKHKNTGLNHSCSKSWSLYWTQYIAIDLWLAVHKKQRLLILSAGEYLHFNTVYM